MLGFLRCTSESSTESALHNGKLQKDPAESSGQEEQLLKVLSHSEYFVWKENGPRNKQNKSAWGASTSFDQGFDVASV